MKATSPVTMKDRAAWREWLARHHDRKKAVWLACSKKHTGTGSVSYADAVEEAICFGWIDGQVRSIDSDRYMQRFSPRKPGSRWSELNIARARKMIDAGLMTGRGRTVFDEAMRENRIVPSRTSFSIPPELSAALAANETAAENFRNLSRSHQLMFAAYIDMAKKEETRKKRVDLSTTLLEQNRKLTDVFGIRKKP